jgi:MGT family glycosyltransferase
MGHEVTFAGEGQYMMLPREAGFQVLPLRTNDPNTTLACSRSGRANWWSYHRLKEGVQADLELLRKVQPDLVLCDFRLSLSPACELLGIPLAVVLNASWSNYYAARQRSPEHFIGTRILGRRFANYAHPWFKAVILRVDAFPFDRVYQGVGLESRGNVFDYWRGDLNLLVDIPEYGPTSNLPENFHYIGPIWWEPDIPIPPQIDSLDPARPTIYLTMGTSGYAQFFHRCVELLGNTQYQCVMTTAGLADLHEVPGNFVVVDYAPGSAILRRSDAVVSHGGNGTIYQAMSQGVPIIGIPTMHDQEYNLQRVVDLGIGIELSEIRFKPAHLLAAIEKITTERCYRETARRYQRILQGYNGPQQGAQLIHDYLSGKPATMIDRSVL